jgi:hypothetical protein
MHFSTGGANVLEEVPAGAGAVEFFSFLTSSFFAAPLVGVKWGGDAAQGRRFFFNAEEEGADTSCFTSVNGGAAEDASVGVHLRGQFTPPHRLWARHLEGIAQRVSRVGAMNLNSPAGGEKKKEMMRSKKVCLGKG